MGRFNGMASTVKELSDRLVTFFNKGVGADNITNGTATTLIGQESTNVLSALGLTGITGAWSAFTPSWTNLTVGNGTNTGYYKQIGKIVYFRINFVFGSTSSISGSVTLSLPVTAANYVDLVSIGLVDLADTGTALYRGHILNTGLIRVFNASATYLTSTVLSSTVPHTWATADIITIQGYYEAA